MNTNHFSESKHKEAVHGAGQCCGASVCAEAFLNRLNSALNAQLQAMAEEIAPVVEELRKVFSSGDLFSDFDDLNQTHTHQNSQTQISWN